MHNELVEITMTIAIDQSGLRKLDQTIIDDVAFEGGRNGQGELEFRPFAPSPLTRLGQ